MAQRSEPATVIVGFGDFNDPAPNLLPLSDSAVATHFTPTHLDKNPSTAFSPPGALRLLFADPG